MTRRITIGLCLVVFVVALVVTASRAGAAHTSACAAAVDPDRRCDRISVLGHRAQGGANENTLKALGQDARVGAGFEIDAWALRDGHYVVFHDEYPCRVVDAATLPPGTSCRTPIYDFTIGQFRQLRTKAHDPQPLPTLMDWLHGAQRLGIPGIIERKQRPGVEPLEAAKTTAMVNAAGAQNLVSFYETPKCGHGRVLHTDMDDFGLTVGAKYLGGCKPTPEEMADAGYRYVICGLAQITRTYVVSVHHYGMGIGNFDSGQVETWTTMAQAGADLILAPHPKRAVDWLTPKRERTP